MTLTEIKATLDTRGLRPLRQLGQNFLHDANLRRTIIDIATDSVAPETPLLEIGPGLGALTGLLLEAGWTVLAIEKDRGLAAFLRERHGRHSRFTLTEGDALDLIPPLQPFPAVVLGNLPYNISTPLLVTLLEHPTPPQRLTFTLQRETAERLVARPGTKNYGAVSVLLQAFYKITLVRLLPGDVFFPRPEVASAIVTLVRHESGRVPPDQIPAFHHLVKRGFSQRRKKLSNLLPIQESRRAEELTVEEWIAVFRNSPIPY